MCLLLVQSREWKLFLVDFEQGLYFEREYSIFNSKKEEEEREQEEDIRLL